MSSRRTEHPPARLIRRVGVVAVVAALAAGVAPLPAHAEGPAVGKTVRVGVDITGGLPNAAIVPTDVSEDGRFVVFESLASDLVDLSGGPLNGKVHVYVRDRLLDVTERVSVSSAEAQGTNDSGEGVISDDGRFVAFTSRSPNLVSGDTNVKADVFVRDRSAGTTTRVSTDSAGGQAEGDSDNPAISGDGRVVAFQSSANDLIASGNGKKSVYHKSLATGVVQKASVAQAGAQADATAEGPSLSEDGTIVVFHSSANNLVTGDTDSDMDVFRRDVEFGTTALVSKGASPGNGASMDADVSADGTVVAFRSLATNLLAAPLVFGQDRVFVRDLFEATAEQISVTSSEVPANEDSLAPKISSDGDRVAFHTFAENLGSVADDGAVAVRDRSAGTTTIISVVPEAGVPSGGQFPVMSPDGRYVAFDNQGVNGVTSAPGYLRILADTQFTDAPPSHAFFEAISWLVDSRITTGFDDGTYRPTADTSRQSAAVFIQRMSGEAAPKVLEPTFIDVPKDHPFSRSIEWAFAEGIVSGFDDGTFRPTAPVSRQSIAAFLYRAAGSPAFTPPAVGTFSDVGTGHTFFQEIEWAESMGIVSGFADGTYRPTSAVSRQAIASMLFNFRRSTLGGPA